jgi:hypothetical protein
MPLYGRAKGLGIIGTETTMFEVGGPLRLRLQADTVSPPTSNLQQNKMAQMVTIRFSLECNDGAKRDGKS